MVNCYSYQNIVKKELNNLLKSVVQESYFAAKNQN